MSARILYQRRILATVENKINKQSEHFVRQQEMQDGSIPEIVHQQISKNIEHPTC